MSESISYLTNELQQKIASYTTKVEVREEGVVIEAGDGIARAAGLQKVRSHQLVEFENGVKGIAFNLAVDHVGIIILGDYDEIREGTKVYSTGRIASVPVGDGLIGRAVNALGEPVDGKGPITYTRFRPIERIAAGVVERQDVNTPVQTGIKAIDAMIPIGRGQRELIIGDRQTGKTALAVDTIINQRGKDLLCIYVAIGQKKAAVARLINIFEQFGAMEHTIVVVASADEAAGLQYIAPYAGCAIGEEFMESGRDALIVYDDLSKHAWAYRQVSLLLRRPPGREAYPGDLFYLHSRLLERAARLADQFVIVPATYPDTQAYAKDSVNNLVYGGPRAFHDAASGLDELPEKDGHKIVKVKGSGGSLTALPIIETLLGDVSAYVPTNVISITDGQIYLEGNLFNAGIRPAVNVGISVSRVGGDAQTKATKRVAGSLRMDMASFREMAAFAQFGSDLDKATQSMLNRGQRLQELLKQPQYQPMDMAAQVIVLFAGTRGFIDNIPVDQIRMWEKTLLNYMDTSYPDIVNEITTTKVLSPVLETKLSNALAAFQLSWKPEA